MEIRATRVTIRVKALDGSILKLAGWAISVDGKILRDKDGGILYASTRRADIDREIARLRFIIEEQIRRDVTEE